MTNENNTSVINRIDRTTQAHIEILESITKALQEIADLLEERLPDPATPGPTPTPTPTPTPEPTPQPEPGDSGYYRPDTPLTEFIKSNSNHAEIETLKRIDLIPTFVWLNGDRSEAEVVKQVTEHLTKAAGKVVGFSLYAIPGRDGGNYSAGGVKDMPTYKAYVGAIGYAIQEAGNPRVDVVIETDALGLNLPTAYEALNAAVDILRKNSNTKVFLTASEWITDTNDMAQRLIGAGVKRAAGVAVNVSGRSVFPDIENYVKDILTKIGDPKLCYLIDTSRNGVKTSGQGEKAWCNTPGTKLGQAPQIFESGPKYAYAWVKPPFESDGQCEGGPAAGALWVDGLINIAK